MRTNLILTISAHAEVHSEIFNLSADILNAYIFNAYDFLKIDFLKHTHLHFNADILTQALGRHFF